MSQSLDDLKSGNDEQRLARRLRQAAVEARPAFDEKLHVRIMEAVDPWRNPVAIYRDPPPSRWARLASGAWLPVSVAASLLIALGLYVLQTSQPSPIASIERIVDADPARLLVPQSAPETSIAQEEPVPTRPTSKAMALALTDPFKGLTLRTSQLPIEAATRLGDLRRANTQMAADMVWDQFAGLDHDARRAANMLLDTIPMGRTLVTPEELVEPAEAP